MRHFHANQSVNCTAVCIILGNRDICWPFADTLEFGYVP